MRHTSVVLDDPATAEVHWKYYSRAQALKINERSHELCSAANILAHKTEQLVESSHRLQEICRELLRDAEMLTARVNSHARGTRFAKEPPQKR